jgi:hypothetical protein
MMGLHLGVFIGGAALVASDAARDFAADVIAAIQSAGSSMKSEAIHAGIDASQLTRELATGRLPLGRIALFSSRVQQHLAVRRAVRVGVPDEYVVAPRLKRVALRMSIRPSRKAEAS